MNQINNKAYVSESVSMECVSVDRYTSIGRNCRIFHTSFGKYCSISWNVNVGVPNHTTDTITTHNFIHSSFYGFVDEYNVKKIMTEVGNDVWIGVNVTILAGIKLGDGCVVGANSLVREDIEPYAIYAGSPAKLIRYRFDNKIIGLLLDLKWWDLDDDFIKNNVKLFSSKFNEDIAKKLIELKRVL